MEHKSSSSKSTSKPRVCINAVKMKKDRYGNARNKQGECVKNALGYASSVTENLEYDYKPDTKRCSALQEYQRILPTTGYKPAKESKNYERFEDFNIEGLVKVDEGKFMFSPRINGVSTLWQHRGQLCAYVRKDSNGLRLLDERLLKAGVYNQPKCPECGEIITPHTSVNGSTRRLELRCGAKTTVLSSTGTATIQCPYKEAYGIYAYTVACDRHYPEEIPTSQAHSWIVKTKYILPQAREKRERLDYAVYSKSGARRDNLLKSIQADSEGSKIQTTLIMSTGNDEDSNAVEHHSISVSMDSVHRIDVTDDEKNAILDSVESKRFSLQEDAGKVGHYYSEDIDLDRAQKEPHHLTRRAHKRETRAFINDKHDDNPNYPANPLSMDDEGYAQQVEDIIYGAIKHDIVLDEPMFEITIANATPVTSEHPTKPTTPVKSIGYSPCKKVDSSVNCLADNADMEVSV